MILDLRGSVLHSVMVSATFSSSLSRPSWTIIMASTPLKLLVPLANRWGLLADQPPAYRSKTTLPPIATRSAWPTASSE